MTYYNIEYFTNNNLIGVRANKDDTLIEVTINNINTNIDIKISDNIKHIDKNFIDQFITPNFTVEMFYFVMCNFLKYGNYKLSYDNDNYTFEGYYTEHYEQSDIIHVKFDV